MPMLFPDFALKCMCVKLSKFLEYLCVVLSFSIVVAAVAQKSLVESASLVIAHGEGEERAEEVSNSER